MGHPALKGVKDRLEGVDHPTAGVVLASVKGDQLTKGISRQTFALHLIHCSARGNLMGHPALKGAKDRLEGVDHPSASVVLENAKWEEDQLVKLQTRQTFVLPR